MSTYKYVAVLLTLIVALIMGVIITVGRPHINTTTTSDTTSTSQTDQDSDDTDNNTPSNFEPWAAFLGIILTGGVLWYIKRGGKEIYLVEPMRTM